MSIPDSEVMSILERLTGGQPPPPKWAATLLVGFDRLLEQWKRDLEEYISFGGSLVRIIISPVGTGKTHLSRALLAIAAESDFLVCQIDAQSQRTNDDLALYEAFCSGLKHPSILLNDGEEAGLLPLIVLAAQKLSGTEVRASLRKIKLPIQNLGDVLSPLIDELRLIMARGGKADKETFDGIGALSALISGQSVLGTRSVAKVRKIIEYPLLKKLIRTPGKRDARLWLESLLLAIRALGFKGVVLVLDEHDAITRHTLDLHIVQLRRTLDKLTEGHLPGVFAVYFVLDNFGSLVYENHIALQQRIWPILEGQVPNRLMCELEDIRGIEGEEFLNMVGARMFGLTSDGDMSKDLMTKCRDFAQKSISIGRVDTRSFVMRFANELLDQMN
jgi:hypothetical protein